MKFIVDSSKRLPSGRFAKCSPYHISLDGKKSLVIFKDDSDLDYMVKCIATVAYRYDVIVVAYCILNNHYHIIVLAENRDVANNFSNAVKKSLSMYYTAKYGNGASCSSLKHTDSMPIRIDTTDYLRKAIAYVLSNSIDVGSRVDAYKWSSYHAYFRGVVKQPVGLKVSDLKDYDKREIMRTHISLRRVPWILDANHSLIPSSFIDYQYVETAFMGDASFFMRTLASCDKKRMEYKLDIYPRNRLNDKELLAVVNDLSLEWFSKRVPDLPAHNKLMLVRKLFYSHKTNTSQIARVLQMDPDEVRMVLDIC